MSAQNYCTCEHFNEMLKCQTIAVLFLLCRIVLRDIAMLKFINLNMHY